ncbi:hypothetical protein GW755_00410 [bacterium]|nr:hypothetical protein [bacterium]
MESLSDLFEASITSHGDLYVELERALIAQVVDCQKGLVGVAFDWEIILSTGYVVSVRNLSQRLAEYFLVDGDAQHVAGGTVGLENYDGPEHLAWDISNSIAAQTRA